MTHFRSLTLHLLTSASKQQKRKLGLGHIGSCHYEGGYIKYMTWCQPYVIHVKRLLRVHLVISGLFKWHKFTSYPSHSAIYCVYWSKIMNISYISTYPLMYHSVLGLYSEEIRRAHLQNRFDFFVKSQRAVLHFCNLTIFRYIHEPNRQFC